MDQFQFIDILVIYHLFYFPSNVVDLVDVWMVRGVKAGHLAFAKTDITEERGARVEVAPPICMGPELTPIRRGSDTRNF